MVALLLLLFAWDLAPVFTARSRETKLRAMAPAGEPWLQVQPKLEREGYRLLHIGTGPGVSDTVVLLTRRDSVLFTYTIRLALYTFGPDKAYPYIASHLESIQTRIKTNEAGEVDGVY